MNGWDESASAWIASMGEHGDRGRQFILDRCMRERIAGRGFRKALDVGCGEGRLCRMMQGWGLETVGLDPTPALLERARLLDPAGRYDEARAEAMPYADAAFDLVVSCLTLIDIPGYRAAITEMTRVLAPGGTLLVANLSSMVTTSGPRWVKDGEGRKLHFGLDNYIAEYANWEEWAGIRILNHHRPLSAYLQAFLANGLRLVHFDEPTPEGADPVWTESQTRVPWFVVMEWHRT
jgi:ubiquinone/menaquinone biosynthesis C-methylase UbiE